MKANTKTKAMTGIGGQTRGRWRLAGAVMALAFSMLAASAQTSLKVFVGNALRPEVMRQIGEAYVLANPGILIEPEQGGATPEAQQKFLAQAISAKDGSLDLVLIDVLRVAQWQAGQVLEPLDAALGSEKEAVLARYWPGLRSAMQIGDKVMALPLTADVQVFYYRKDLLEKYGIAVPKTWDEVKAATIKVLEGEKSPVLRGLGLVGAPVESAVCTYLATLWGQGEDLVKGGKLALEGEAPRKPFELFADLKAARVLPQNPAEMATDRVRAEMQAGNLIFGIGWAYMMARFQGDADSSVRDKIGIAPLPAFNPAMATGCLGGWQAGVLAASKQKAEALKFARFLASPEALLILAREGAHLPVFEAGADLLAAKPWYGAMAPLLKAGRLRPITPRYPEVSEAIRANIAAFMAGTRNTDAALTDLRNRLGVIFR